MERRWEEFKATLTDERSMSKKEFLLMMAVCVLGGIVFSPRKSTVIGSHNGNGYDEDDKKAKDKKSKKKSGVVDWEEVEQKEL